MEQLETLRLYIRNVLRNLKKQQKVELQNELNEQRVLRRAIRKMLKEKVDAKLTFGFNGVSQNYNTASGTNVFTANTWAMFTTVIQAGTSYVYVNDNSTPVISQTTSDSFSFQANLQIGQSIQGDGSYLPMTWGQFRYYKGKALSTSEISTLFNDDKSTYGL